jgi:GAF domain-containing protein
MQDSDAVKTACERAQAMLDTGSPPHEILTCLVTAAEIVSAPRAVGSILVLDENGLLRNGASPNLPRDYLDAIDRLKPDPRVGTCAAAAATGSMVLTPDFLADEKWAELRHLPLALGFVGAWSMPIKSDNDGRVLGTFGTYYKDLREPTALEQHAYARLPRRRPACWRTPERSRAHRIHDARCRVVPSIYPLS